MVVVVILVFEDDDDDKVDDDDGEDPSSFPKHAFVLAFPFAFPFRPDDDEDLLRVQRKENAGEEVTESNARIFMSSSSGRSKVQTVFFFRARANGLTTRLRRLEGKTFSASNASHEQTTRLIKARVFRERRRRRRRRCAQNTRTNFI